MKKKLFAIILSLVLVLSMVACGSESEESDAKTVKLKMSTAVPETSSWHVGAKYFADEINARTNGKFEVEIFTSDQLSGGNQVGGIEMLQEGSTDLHMQDALLWSSIEPKIGAVAFPWLFTSYEDVDRAMEGEAGKIIADLINNNGAVYIGIGEAGYRQIVNNKTDIVSPEDLKGMKLRVPGIEMYVNLFKMIGADPISMNQSEVYTSLQQGALDGCENTLDLLVSQNTLEVVDNITIWNYSYDPVIFSASNKLWDSLTDDEKAVFKEVGAEAMEKQKAAARESYEESYNKMKEYDLKVSELNAQQIDAFKEAVKPLYEQYKDTIGEDVFSALGYTFK